jgi:hypothetical protein
MILENKNMSKPKRTKSLIFGSIVGILILCFVLSCPFSKYEDTEPKKGEIEVTQKILSKKELIQIAGKAVKDRCGLDVDKCRITYDTGNKIWNKYYAENFPNLIGRDYQAICFERTGQLQIGGGPYWICIDKKTGEVLQMDVGM